MNRGPILFIGAFLALASSWFGLVLRPQIEVGQLQQTNTVGSAETYPVARPGLANQGLQVYRANGCVHCHSQCVRQSGVTFDVVLANLGTNQAEVVAVIEKLRPDFNVVYARKLVEGKVRDVLHGVTKAEADAAQKALEAGGARAQIQLVALGPDIARGWGNRRSVAADYLFDYPVQLGSQRIGPDLANIGLRPRTDDWHLLHFYDPRTVVEGSTMPPHRYLFEKRKVADVPSPDALKLPAQFALPSGWEIVPKPEAMALVAYLNSLKADAPLFEAPAPLPSATTQPSAVVNATSTSNTNPPAK